MANKILIVGYGVAGQGLAASLRENNEEVLGFLDDMAQADEVLGKLEDVNNVIAKYDVENIYFAIPSAPAKTFRDFVNRIEKDDVTLRMLPRDYKTISKQEVNINELTDVDIMSMIGREPVKHDLLASKKLIEGKTVLVTGAAGSIGSKLVKFLLTLKPKHVVCVDWWENGTFYLQQDLGQDDTISYHIADIKNIERISQIFAKHKPEIVLHAAAYKHVPLMQHNPVEAYNNNVWGSLNIMRQCINHGVKNFVLVSTDKAVNPANVMGSTKRLAEMLLEVMANSHSKTKFNAVRFGNVIQSNGSVMHIFKKQIEQGQPLTVTHEDVTRYFMTVEEAAQLIVQSTAIGKNGEIFVLDMGEPIKVIDLAKSLIRVLNKPIDIKITGLRPGEKMFEELAYDDKSVDKTAHDKIFVVKSEKPFDHEDFVVHMDTLIDKTLRYDITNENMISTLKGMGFPIKD